MRYKLMLSALAVAVMAYAAVAAPIGSPGGFDPGAARKDLSNVDPATGRTALDAEQAGVAAAHVASTGTDVHGLGTMAIATATDYVATDTFTAHTGNTSNPHGVTYSQLSDKPTFGTMASETATNYVATSTLTAHESDTSTHGKTTIAGMEDIDDLSGVTDAATARTNLGVAASSATVLTSGANAMMGNFKLGGHWLSNDGDNEGLLVTNDGRVLVNTSTDDGSNEFQVSGSANFTDAATTRLNLGLSSYRTSSTMQSSNAGQCDFFHATGNPVTVASIPILVWTTSSDDSSVQVKVTIMQASYRGGNCTVHTGYACAYGTTPTYATSTMNLDNTGAGTPYTPALAWSNGTLYVSTNKINTSFFIRVEAVSKYRNLPW